VVSMLVSDAMAGVLIGLTLGIPLALMAGRLVAPYLFKVESYDPVSFMLVCVGLTFATAAASFVPAQKAGRASPAGVLRGE
jgi:ABC-type lipoprotein release transport system permease subunit